MKKNYINKRKKNFVNLKFSLSFFFCLILFSFIYLNFSSEKLSDISNNLIQKYSDKYEYNFLTIKISKLEYISKDNILKYFINYQNKSIFLVPISKISEEIYQNKWVKNLYIKSDYKNSINISIEEEKPFGIYDNKNQKILFSQNLVYLDILQNNVKYPKLITFYGENSINNSVNLIYFLKNDLNNKIKSASFIKNRRWNLELKNSILLKLPEINIEEAIKNYVSIYKNFSNKDLKDIESIDLRIKNQAIIKYIDKVND